VATPKLTCQASTTIFTGQSQNSTRSFGYLRIYDGWFQADGGSVYGGGGISSTIPGTLPLNEQYLILDSGGGGAGTSNCGTDNVASFKTGSIDLGTYPGVTVSSDGVNANTGYGGDDPDYQYFKAKMGSFPKTAWNGLSQPTYSGGSGNHEIYTHTGDVTINWSPGANQRTIYLIDGDVIVSGDITIPKTGTTFMAVFASGSIIFNPDVTHVDGWWVGRSLAFPCDDDSPADSICDETDVQFVGEGSFIGYDSITLLRDQGIINNDQPAELFICRSDLMLNVPEPMYVSRYIWRYK
jgi:hypothetical protein